jgi:hypothetical protein
MKDAVRVSADLPLVYVRFLPRAPCHVASASNDILDTRPNEFRLVDRAES